VAFVKPQLKTTGGGLFFFYHCYTARTWRRLKYCEQY